MGCNTSRDVAGLESKEEKQSVQHDRETIRGSSSFSSNASSIESEADPPESLRSDLEQVSSPQSLRNGTHRKERHNSGHGIIPQTNGFDNALEFIENIPLGELSGLEPLATGGFCLVFSCVYRGQNAALKIPRPDGPEGAVEDLLAEIHVYKLISARGGHANITRAFGSGTHVEQDQEVPFILLEKLDGHTLGQLLDYPHPPRSVWEDLSHRLQLGLDLAEAICFLHNEAVPGGFILHRDLKPANIGLCDKGYLKLFDLGLSVVQEVKEGRDDKYEMSGMAGSKRFMAPEVCQGVPYNEKVDVYSFSIVLWELCTRSKPFPGMSVAEHFQDVIVGGKRPPLDPTWTESLRHLFEACWDVDPDRRPPIAEARDALRNILAGEDVGGAEQEAEARQRTKSL